MASDNLEKRLELLESRQEIMELSCRYSIGQDRLNAEAQRSVFWDDAWIELGYFSGGPDEFVEMAQGALEACDVTQHLLGQMIIDFVDNDTAYGQIYTIANHRMPGDQPADLIMAGRYCDHYERRDGVWKIAYRAEVVDWQRLDPADNSRLPEMAAAALGPRRDGTDLSQQRERQRRPE